MDALPTEAVTVGVAPGNMMVVLSGDGGAMRAHELHQIRPCLVCKKICFFLLL